MDTIWTWQLLKPLKVLIIQLVFKVSLFSLRFSFVLCMISVSSGFLFLFVLVPTFHVRSFLKCLLNFWQFLRSLPWHQIWQLEPKRLTNLEQVNRAGPAVALGKYHQRGLWQIPSVSGYMNFHLGWPFSLRKNLIHFQYETSHLPHCGWYPQTQSLLDSVNPGSKPQPVDPETFHVHIAMIIMVV